jgi:hypothetical protein
MPVEPPIQPTVPEPEMPDAPQPGQPETPLPEVNPTGPDIDIPSPQPSTDPGSTPIQPMA